MRYFTDGLLASIMSRESGGGATVIPKIRNCTVAWGKGIPRVRPYFRAYNLLPKYWGMSSLKRKRTCLFSKRFGKKHWHCGRRIIFKPVNVSRTSKLFSDAVVKGENWYRGTIGYIERDNDELCSLSCINCHTKLMGNSEVHVHVSCGHVCLKGNSSGSDL